MRSVKDISRLLAESSSSPISLRLHDVSANWILLEASSLRHPPRLLLAKISVTKSQEKRKEKESERVFQGQEEDKEKETDRKEKKKDSSLLPSVEIDLIGSICLGGSSDPQVIAKKIDSSSQKKKSIHSTSISREIETLEIGKLEAVRGRPRQIDR